MSLYTLLDRAGLGSPNPIYRVTRDENDVPYESPTSASSASSASSAATVTSSIAPPTPEISGPHGTPPAIGTPSLKQIWVGTYEEIETASYLGSTVVVPVIAIVLFVLFSCFTLFKKRDIRELADDIRGELKDSWW